jgi:hypothetical protein
MWRQVLERNKSVWWFVFGGEAACQGFDSTLFEMKK